ncbi:hypothetical protein YTPLAS18_28610 [Nitrospira sp.]|nr:hypothetical protein YTPLAS18_28610 [Nitrospira sp.]
MWRRLIRGVMGALCLASCGVSLGWAEESHGSRADRWSFSFSPYLYASGLKGTVRTLPPLPSSNVDASFHDIVDNLDLAFMGAAELRKGRFGILTDVMWTKISADGTTPGPVFSGTRLGSETLMATVAGVFRIAEDEHIWVDLVAGVRGYYVNTDLNFQAGLLPARTSSSTAGWVDGLGGLRARVKIWRGLYASGTAVVGGGGSDILVDVLGGLGYAFTEHISIFAGYRYIKVDYEKTSGFIWDVEYQGPLAGVSFTF